MSTVLVRGGLGSVSMYDKSVSIQSEAAVNTVVVVLGKANNLVSSEYQGGI